MIEDQAEHETASQVECKRLQGDRLVKKIKMKKKKNSTAFTVSLVSNLEDISMG